MRALDPPAPAEAPVEALAPSPAPIEALAPSPAPIEALAPSPAPMTPSARRASETGPAAGEEQRSATDRALVVVRALEEEIALGHLRPRERLTEEDLAARFDVKRHVIRQALLELETMGIVVRQPNRGATVRDFRAEDVENIYLVRELVERRAAELIPLPGAPKLVAALRRIHKSHCAAVARRDLRRVFRDNLLFHSTFFAACGVPPLAEAIEQFALRAHAIRSYTIGDPDLLARVCEDHARLIDLLARGDREGLVALVTAHIQPAKAAYLRSAGFRVAR